MVAANPTLSATQKNQGLGCKNPSPCSLVPSLTPERGRGTLALIVAASSQALQQKVLLGLPPSGLGVLARGVCGCGRLGFVPGVADVPGRFPAAVIPAGTAGGRHRPVGAVPIWLHVAVLERGAPLFLQPGVRGLVHAAAGPVLRVPAVPVRRTDGCGGSPAARGAAGSAESRFFRRPAVDVRRWAVCPACCGAHRNVRPYGLRLPRPPAACVRRPAADGSSGDHGFDPVQGFVLPARPSGGFRRTAGRASSPFRA